ncbi:MAG TPA: monovalent cation/H(+) antiporter subunit G [Solirubrobacteraceae bacterium]|nr:monovalent cation/H(+) antiporter subunit G [Solirubrobacteraceae bacterium]
MAWVADALVVLGLVVMTLGVVGLFRMPGVLLQLHAASKAVFLGVIAFCVASTATGDGQVIARATLIAAFLLLTTPVAAHAIARASHRTGHGRAPERDAAGGD